jgi:aconitate hydratase
MSCIGNSGSIAPRSTSVADRLELTSVLSGNRNFDGRISPDVSQNYLCEPALVVAYSLAGPWTLTLPRSPWERVPTASP